MWVDPAARRRGIAHRGCWPPSPARPTGPARRRLHLQTDTDNTSALALYERHGFERHHAYVNLSRPSRSAPPP